MTFEECMKRSFTEIGVAPQINTPAWRACKHVWDSATIAAASCCADIAVNRQGTVSQFPTMKECVAFNEGCRDVFTSIREKFGLEI